MNIKKIILFVSLFSLLLMGQSSAATVTEVTIDYFNDGTDYSVDAWWVGTSSADQDELSNSTYGTYDIVSATGIVTLNIKVNVTGFSSWKGKYAYGATVGQLDLFVDGYVVTVGAGYAAGTGATVSIIGEGDHTISYLYSNMDEDGTFHYATDSITVRLRATDSFAAYTTTTFPLAYSASDSAVAGNIISRAHIYFSGSGYSKNTSLSVGNNAVVDVVSNDDGTRSVSVTGSIDSTGSMDSATDEWVKTTVGRVFIVDAAGVHLYEGGAMDVTLRAEDPLTSTFLGLYVLGDAGIFYEETDLDRIAPSTSDDTGNEVEFDYSFDFLGKLVGGSFGNIPTATVKKTIESITTEVETVETGGLPGFSGFEALLGLLSLGTIAFLIPRRFRK